MAEDKKEENLEEGVGTTGHEWDGIREWNNPLPRWWLWTFYVTIIWGIGYTIAYPAWPLIERATPGLLGFSTRAQVQEDIDAVNEANRSLDEKLVQVELAELQADAALHDYAVKGGAAVFRAQCSQCHGSGAAGAVGFPNLLDDDWLWGGDIETIAWSIRHGIRNEDDPDAHWSEMPAYGEMFSEEEISQVVAYVQQISNQEHDAGLAEAGSVLFYDNCAACHGDEGMGDPSQGAPNLTDAIWLYGGDEVALTETVTNARFGVMPAWGLRLTEAQVRSAAAYVHALGGGE